MSRTYYEHNEARAKRPTATWELVDYVPEVPGYDVTETELTDAEREAFRQLAADPFRYVGKRG